MIIKPITDAFPACAVQLRVNMRSATGRIICPFSGAVVKGSTIHTFTDLGSGRFGRTGGNGAQIESGSIRRAAATDTIVAIAVCDTPGNAGFAIGNTIGGPGIGGAPDGNVDIGYATADASNWRTCPSLATISAITAGVLMLVFDPTTGIAEIHAQNGATYESAAFTGSDGTLLNKDFSGFSEELAFLTFGGPGVTNFYGIYILYFSQKPTAAELQFVCNWMKTYPMAGLPSVWVGRT